MIAGRLRLEPASRLLCDAASFAVPMFAYAASASREPGSWDTAELQGVPYILGIAHPTGFPLYVLLGYAWSHAIAIGSIAFRMNLMSGVAMAIAAAAAYAVALELGAWRPLALTATWWYAFCQDVWSHAARAEAQDLAVALEAIAMYSLLRWLRAGDRRWLLGAAALWGLALATHPNAMWLGAGFIVAAIVRRPRPNARTAFLAAGVCAAALLLYAYLPLRSAYVVAHHLDPTSVLPGAAGGIFWNYNDPSTARGLLRTLSGTESEAPRYLLGSLNPVHVQQALLALVDGIAEQFGAFALAIGAAGAIFAWRRDWRATLVLCAGSTAALAFSVTYANEADVGRYRLLALWLMVPLLASVAAGAPWNAAAALRRWTACAFFAIEAAVSVYHQRQFFSHASGEGGRWVIDAVRPVVPPGAAIVVNGWLDATSLAYGAYVDGSLPQRIVVSGWDPMHAAMYRQWAQRRAVFVLADPHAVVSIAGAGPAVRLDAYHELFQIMPTNGWTR